MESLATSAPQTVRLRFNLSSDWRAPIAEISVDKFTVAELPAPVSMLPVNEVDVDTLRLNWEPSGLPAFSEYAIFRATSANVSDQSLRVATITDPTVATFTDTGLDARIQYFYRVYLVDDRDTYSPSEVVSATTMGIALPYNESFDSASAGWTFTGNGACRRKSVAMAARP
jgi:hypothetical protein